MDRAATLATAALARGDLIAAYDLAASAIAAGDDSSELRHQQVLALARMGDTDRAMELFTASRLDLSPRPHERAIGARLLKDRAFAEPDAGMRGPLLHQAFDAYQAIYRVSGDPFPGINAATLALLAGDTPRSRELAETLLADPAVEAPDDYYAAATKAEALLLLGRLDALDEVLRSPAVRRGRDYGALSTTARQLAMIARHIGLDDNLRERLLAPLSPPRIAHFCGHMFAADPAPEAKLTDRIGDLLDEEGVGFVYGALACGADLLIAEAALARGAELHVVLPFEEEDFLAQSVRPGGESWVARYRACVAQASSFTVASATEYFGDPAQFSYGSRLAMGLARLRAQHLRAEMVQIAVWDGAASIGPAGSGADVAVWTGLGGRSRIVESGAVDRDLERPDPRSDGAHQRTLAAILFTDFAGFSTLRESALPAFWNGVMRQVAAVLDAHGSDVVCRNSWGDALYAVATSAPAAARIALELQNALSTFDYSSLGLAGAGGMRIAAHYGPAYRTTDPITGRTTFYGTEVSRAARIEPVTPPHAVFVTEPFAAALALEASGDFVCRYVGRIPLAKKYGEHPMYRLTRAGSRAVMGPDSRRIAR